MDILIFAEYLIAQSVSENDYAADMTLSGIIHFLYLARHLALKDTDMDEYGKMKNLLDQIFLMRETARLHERKAEISV